MAPLNQTIINNKAQFPNFYTPEQQATVANQLIQKAADYSDNLRLAGLTPDPRDVNLFGLAMKETLLKAGAADPSKTVAQILQDAGLATAPETDEEKKASNE